jgi:hypothetical protein|tara:strand:- start:69 stop:830 length:762 start_codon:yes stop_codon:yes gene_type:complete
MMERNHAIIDAFNATRRSSPSYQFGSAIRPRLSEAEPTPGAGAYSIKTTILGNVPDSKIHSAPQFSLRSREKFGNPMLRSLDADTAREPGPGWYSPKQVNPKDDNAPKYSFPKGHFIKDKARLSPGPGAYVIPSSVGKQVLSTKFNNNGMGFGQGERPPLLRTHNDVGPGEYGAGISACKKQVDSRKRTSGFVKFSRCARDKMSSMASTGEHDLPGPGTYQLPSGLCGSGSSYPFRSAPKSSLSGREKFGSPF